MNDLQNFANGEFGTIRTITEDSIIWFCGSDVAKALGYADTVNALKRHCKPDGVVKRHTIDSMGRTQQTKFISEPNLYRLICNSKLPSADHFEKWVFEEVLPAIRKTGAYKVEIKEALKVTKDDWLRMGDWISHTPKERFSYLIVVLNEMAPGKFNEVIPVTQALVNTTAPSTNHFAERLTALMLEHGMNQKNLVIQLGCAKGSVS